MKFSEITLDELKKGVLRKGNYSAKNTGADVKLSISENQKTVNFVFYNDIFKNFKYIVFYYFDNRLFFSLSNNQSENSYSLMHSKSNPTTKVSGGNTKIVRNFLGEHNINIYNKTKNNPLIYIEKSRQ